MALEKRWEGVSQAFTANGTQKGVVQVADATGFFAKQQVSLYSNTQSRTVYEVKRVYPTEIWVGLVGTGIDRYEDVSAYTVADSATITANEQVKPSIKPEDILQAVYQRDPAAALRNLLVDKFGNPFDAVIGPDGKRRLAVDAAVTVSGLSVDIKGVYNALSNPTPDNVGMIGHQRSLVTDDTKQLERITAKRGTKTADADSVSMDVSLHDEDGNRYDEFNPLVTSPPSKLIDAFGRPRISSATIFYSEHFSDDAHTFDWVTRLTTGGTSTFDKTKARVSLSATTASGSAAVTQSRRYFQYIPGQAMLAIFSGVFAAPKANVEQIIGFLDDSDGLYFQVDSTTINIGIRTSTSGAPVSTLVPRSSWNVDRLDGTGPSGLNIDFTYGQIFVIDFEWLGYGKIRWGVFANGNFHYCHEITNINTLSNAYMQRGSLPIRYSIRNTAGTASSTTLQQGCVSLIGEGNANIGKITQGVSNGIIGVAVGTVAFTFPLAIRLNSNYNKSEARPEEISIFTTSNTAIYYEVVANATITGGTWVQETNSILDANRTVTAVTGGKIIHSGYLSSTTKGSLSAATRTQYRLGFDTLNNIPDTLVIRARTLSGNATAYATIDVTEIF